MERGQSWQSDVSQKARSRRTDIGLRQLDDYTATFLVKDHTWFSFAMIPPPGLTKEHFKERSHDLALELQRRLDIPEPPAINVQLCAGLDSTTLHHSSLSFSVTFTGSVQRTKLRGLFSNIDSKQYHLLLCRGSRRVMNLVVEFVADAFSCYINPLHFTPNDLSDRLAYWCALMFGIPRFHPDPITIQLGHPVVTDCVIELDLPVGRIGRVGDGEIGEHDGSRVLAVFLRSSLLNLKLFKLRGVCTPGVNFNAEGNVKFVQREFAGEALAYLTKIAGWKVEPEIEEQSVEGSS